MPLPALKKGALDDYTEEEMCDTLKNVRCICNELIRRQKRVVLATVPTSGAGLHDKIGQAKRLNRQLTIFVRSLPSGSNVHLFKLSDPKLMRPELRCFDGLHPNSAGTIIQTVLQESASASAAAAAANFCRLNHLTCTLLD
jgi:hypothetical protein